MTEPQDLFRAGQAALAAGEWADALAALEAVEHPTAEVLDGIGRARWWLGQPDEALHARTEAYTAHRDEGDDVAATRLAVWLAREYRDGKGNEAVATGCTTPRSQ